MCELSMKPRRVILMPKNRIFHPSSPDIGISLQEMHHDVMHSAHTKWHECLNSSLSEWQVRWQCININFNHQTVLWMGSNKNAIALELNDWTNSVGFLCTPYFIAQSKWMQLKTEKQAQNSSIDCSRRTDRFTFHIHNLTFCFH